MKGLKFLLVIAATAAIVATTTVLASASAGVSTEPCPRCKGVPVVYDTITFWVDYTEHSKVCLHECTEEQDFTNARMEVWIYDCADCFATWFGMSETGWVWECKDEVQGSRSLFHPRYRMNKNQQR